jgi:dTDP-glucose 4,6-dehydratase
MTQEFHEASRLTPEGEQKVALVDIDETICFYPGKRRYDLSEPNHENIAKINKLYYLGWKIIYWTARGSVSGKDYRDHTLEQLHSWGCEFHELKTGSEKPHFDLVIDDKAKRIEEL